MLRTTHPSLLSATSAWMQSRTLLARPMFVGMVLAATLLCGSPAWAQFRFGGGGGGFRLPIGGGGTPRISIPIGNNGGRSNNSIGNSVGNTIRGVVGGGSSGSKVFKPAVEPNRPALGGLPGAIFGAALNSKGNDFVPLPIGQPPRKKSLPEIVIPLVLNHPFQCVKPPCEPRPVQPHPVPVQPAPGDANGGRTNPNERPLSEIERVARDAKQAFQQQQFDKAMTLANRMNDLAPKNSGVLQFRAAVYQAQLKYPQAAIDTYNAILAGPIWTRVNIKEVYVDPAAYQRDLNWLRATTEEQPNELAHQFLSAYHAHVAEDWDRCRIHLEKMLQLQPGEAVAVKLLEKVNAKAAGG